MSRFKNNVSPDVMVHADERRLEQMLTNLIDNGIKFSRENGTVAISHEAGTRDQILVQDNGDGIPAQHLERLFERFYRVDRARSRDMGGTGLGLAIVKHLALLHGGEVTVTSELGKGTTFTIHLPTLKIHKAQISCSCEDPVVISVLRSATMKNTVVNSASALQ